MERRPPRLCRHKGQNLAYATDPRTGRETYFGAWDDPASAARYAAWLKDLADGKPPLPRGFKVSRPQPPPVPRAPRGRALAVADLCALFLDHAERYYRKDGKETKEVGSFRQVLRRLNARDGARPALTYGPRDLAALRDQMAREDLARGHVNAQVRRVVRVWRWAVAEELLPPERLTALETVAPLRKGRGAREGKKVTPVAAEVVEATLPYLPARVAALVRFQLYGAMRPGEAVVCRPCDLDRRREPWEYRPRTHKGEHHEGEPAERVIYLGPKARAALAPRLERCRRPTAWVWPGRWLDCYRPRSYRKAVTRAVGLANAERDRRRLPPLPHWCPLQLRHSAATVIRAARGLDAAQAVLGHSELKTTQIYTAINREKARKAAEELG